MGTLRLLLATLLILTGTRAMATDITSCGATIAPGDTGTLRADLDCSTFPVGVLDLNGHAIQGSDATTATVQGTRKPDGTGRR